MTTEISIPFTLDVNGHVATTEVQYVQSDQHVSSLVSTSPGERVMLPDYGIPLKTYLFDPGADFVDSLIIVDVRAQMNLWEPSLTITSITPLPSDSAGGLAAVNVSWENTPVMSPLGQNAVKLVGGTVVNQ